jgi:hypothetical protein
MGVSWVSIIELRRSLASIAQPCIHAVFLAPTVDGDVDQSKEQLISPRQTRENVLTCTARIDTCVRRTMMLTASSPNTRISVLLAAQEYR